MKNIQLPDREIYDVEDNKVNSDESRRIVNKKVDTVFKAVIVGMIAVFLALNPHFARFIPPELVLMLISGIALILCINVVLFCFIKPRAWIYRVIAAIVSLLIGYCQFRFLISELADLEDIVPDFLFYFLEPDPELPWVEIIEGVYLVYAAVIFGAALVVQYIYKRIKRKTVSTP